MIGMILAVAVIFGVIFAWVGLAAFGLYDLLQPHRTVRNLGKNVWAVVIIFGSVLGLFLYFAVGREHD
jgi:hypothetical protein